MNKDIKTGCVSAVMLMVAMAWAADAHAQRSPWWERQKEARTTAGQPASAPGEQGAQASAPPTVAPPYAPAVQREKIEGPAYTYVEAGVGRVDVDLYDVDESVDGGYVRGSLAVTDNLYVFGGHDRVSESERVDAVHAKVTIDQTEIGLGSSISISSRADFTSELSLLRLGAKVEYTDAEFPQDNFDVSDHLYAGKLMLGIRARPVSSLELWAKAGYLHVDDNLVIDDSMVGNLGIQYRFTPTWGVVGEAEFYEDVRFYRLGVRASF